MWVQFPVLSLAYWVTPRKSFASMPISPHAHYLFWDPHTLSLFVQYLTQWAQISAQDSRCSCNRNRQHANNKAEVTCWCTGARLPLMNCCCYREHHLNTRYRKCSQGKSHWKLLLFSRYCCKRTLTINCRDCIKSCFIQKELSKFSVRMDTVTKLSFQDKQHFMMCSYSAVHNGALIMDRCCCHAKKGSKKKAISFQIIILKVQDSSFSNHRVVALQDRFRTGWRDLRSLCHQSGTTYLNNTLIIFFPKCNSQWLITINKEADLQLNMIFTLNLASFANRQDALLFEQLHSLISIRNNEQRFFFKLRIYAKFSGNSKWD